jgi:hypothetical protein
MSGCQNAVGCRLDLAFPRMPPTGPCAIRSDWIANIQLDPATVEDARYAQVASLKPFHALQDALNGCFHFNGDSEDIPVHLTTVTAGRHAGRDWHEAGGKILKAGELIVKVLGLRDSLQHRSPSKDSLLERRF